MSEALVNLGKAGLAQYSPFLKLDVSVPEPGFATFMVASWLVSIPPKNKTVVSGYKI